MTAPHDFEPMPQWHSTNIPCRFCGELAVTHIGMSVTSTVLAALRSDELACLAAALQSPQGRCRHCGHLWLLHDLQAHETATCEVTPCKCTS